MEQAERSHSLYADFERAQAPYKAALDIWVSRHFGNAKAREYLTLAGPNLVEQIRSGGTGLSPDYQEAITEGRKTGAGNRFFHWDLEFPEAFVDLGRGTWKRKEDQGFDAVVGNPPWLSYSGRQRVSVAERTVRYFKNTYSSGNGGWLSTHGLFLERNASLLQETGFLGLIIPAQVADLEGYASVREYIAGIGVTQEPCPYHGENAFEGVTEPSITVIFERKPTLFNDLPHQDPWTINAKGDASIDTTTNPELLDLFEYLQDLPSFDKEVFGDSGVHTGNASKELITSDLGPANVPIREGRDITPYYVRAPRIFLRLDTTQKDGTYFRIGPRERYKQCPIVLRQTASRPIAALHRDPTYFRNSVLACYGVTGLSDGTLVALLNSDLLAWLHIRANRDAQQRSFPQVKISHLRRLPRPPDRKLAETARVREWVRRLTWSLQGEKET